MFRTAVLLLVAFTATAVPVWSQSGLLGEYFNGSGLTNLVETRVDESIDFTTWGSAPTGTSVTPDGSYSERWTGFVRIDSPGTWTFTTNSNDGVRLWIDDDLIVDDWTSHAAKMESASKVLDAGWYPLRLEHYQQGGGVVIQLFFQGPNQPKVIVPTSNLGLTINGSLPPLVSLGVDKLVVAPSQQLTMTAEVSDPDSTTLTYAWEQLAGPPVMFFDANTASATVTEMALGNTYRFRMTATDEAGASASDDVQVTVIEGNVGDGIVSGEQRLYHRTTVNFIGSPTSENASPNPFLDRRLEVLFVHLETGTPMIVPGFFAADGDAAESGAAAGSIWRAHLTPGLDGYWFYKASFRAGTEVAISLESDAGVPTQFNGQGGTFFVEPVDPDAPGFLSEGHLVYDGTHYLSFTGSGRTYLKGGANSPENLLAYADFDQTVTHKHTYQPHVQHWNAGDPVWKGNKGKGLIGGINYLSGKGINAMYFLTFNVAGDGDDVWPWTSKGQRERFDVSKLEQWEIAFDHMDRRGIMLHVVTQETENDTGNPALDNGNLEVERKLYYRELIARFGHHLAVTWNLGEENTNSTNDILEFYDYFVALDAYQHPVVIHTFPSSMEQVYEPLLDEGALEGASLQLGAVKDTHERTLCWREKSAAQGTPWVVSLDEIGPASKGVLPDLEDLEHNTPRIEGLWGNLMAGGGGVEWYFGYNYDHTDLNCEDWASRDIMWDQTRYALEFFARTDFASLIPSDGLITHGNWCTANPGNEYVGFLKNDNTATISIAEGTYDVLWYDPRNGGDGQLGSVTTVTGPGFASIGTPPSTPNDDWAVHLTRQTSLPLITNAVVVPEVYTTGPLAFYVVVEDDDGLGDIEQVTLHFFSPTGVSLGYLTAPLLPSGLAFGLKFPPIVGIPPGTYTVGAQVIDSSGNEDLVFTSFLVP